MNKTNLNLKINCNLRINFSIDSNYYLTDFVEFIDISNYL
jgi:hypothetical protein